VAAMFAFALGSSSLEGSKHLQLADAGLLVGVERFPHLRTLRPRLGALADSVDPLGVQVAFAKAMLDADRDPPEVLFVDEHFVAYTGARPVSKGWNTRRRHAEPGRHETVIVDDRWRAICFASGPPQGLASGMLGPLDQLRAICGERALMIGFDRGGAYPKAFTVLRDRGMDWVTYRRAPLAAATVEPRSSWVRIDGRRHYLRVADEQVELDGYGTARQITLYEHDRVVLQILTSDCTSSAARLAHTLRCRWCIENTFKYLEDHHGLHWLCDYHMNLAPDTTPVRNPQRTEALAQLRAHEQTVNQLEQKIGQHTTSPPTAGTDPAHTLCMLEADLYTARADTRAAKAALKPIPAKLPANTINSDAQRATPRINRRALQTVCRLLAYNAELDLARAINTYLQDPNEYRAITRHLLHQPGHIHYTPDSITVTIDPPHAPRIARALNLLIEQINTTHPNSPATTAKSPTKPPPNLDIRSPPTTGDLSLSSPPDRLAARAGSRRRSGSRSPSLNPRDREAPPMGCCNGVQGTRRWKLQAAFPYLPRSHGLCIRSARTLRLRRRPSHTREARARHEHVASMRAGRPRTWFRGNSPVRCGPSPGPSLTPYSRRTASRRQTRCSN